MAKGKETNTGGQIARIRLTEEQRKELAQVFGKDILSRLEAIEVEQIAGYLKASAVLN